MSQERVTVEGVVVRHDDECGDTIWWSVDSEADGCASDAMLEDFEGQRVRWIIEPLDGAKPPSIEEQIVAKVREWFRRQSVVVADGGHASFSIAMRQTSTRDDTPRMLNVVTEESRVSGPAYEIAPRGAAP